MAIQNKALLVALNIKQWSARKLDRAETAAIAAKHNTLTEVARVNKSLLPFDSDLAAVHQANGELRTFFYANTLPWSVSGMAALSTAGYLDFLREATAKVSNVEGLVRKFVDNYPAAREKAKSLLNNLWRADDYPDPSDMARRFSVGIKFYPMPTAGDWRLDLTSDETDALRAQVEADTKASIDGAMTDLWRRVYSVVEKARERLAQPDAVFRDTLVENARDLCDMLPALNLTDDPELVAMGKLVRDTLCTYNPDTLRHDPTVRADVASRLSDIERKMAGAYGQ